MAASALTAGEERVNLLIRMTPIDYPGCEIIEDGLAVLVSILLSNPDYCEALGIEHAVQAKFEEIKAVRQTRANIDDVEVDLLYDFFTDVLRAFAGPVRRKMTRDEFIKVSDFKPTIKLHGMDIDAFPKIYSAISSLSFVFFPADWAPLLIERGSGISYFDLIRSPGVCYYELFHSQYQPFIIQMLGRYPTLGSVLSFMTPKLARTAEQLDKFELVRRKNTKWHLKRASVGAHDAILASSLLKFVDDDESRSQGVMYSFDRIGAAEEDVTPFSEMFSEACHILDEMAGSNLATAAFESVDTSVSPYLDVIVKLPEEVDLAYFPDRENSLRLRNDNGYISSLLTVWPSKVREQALSLALRQYNQCVMNVEIVSHGLAVIKAMGVLARVSSSWRIEVAETVSLSNTDAVYWYELLKIIADGFRELVPTDTPPWLSIDKERKHSEFLASFAANLGDKCDPSSRRSSQTSNSSSTSRVSFAASTVSAASTSSSYDFEGRKAELMKTASTKIPGFKYPPWLIYLVMDGTQRKRHKEKEVVRLLRLERRAMRAKEKT